jgi:hypothetical protein
MEASATFWGHSVIHKTGFSRVPSPLGFGHATDRDMRTVDNHILTRSHEDKNWRRTQHTPVHFQTVLRLDYKFALWRCRQGISEESIVSGINGMELVLSPWYKASHQTCCSRVLARACVLDSYRPMSWP